MAFKHYDVVQGCSASDLAEKLTQKIMEGWQPLGGPVAVTPYTLVQAVIAEGNVTGFDGTSFDYVIVLAGQSNGMSYGEGLPLPETYDRPDPRIKQLARRSTVTPGGKACSYNDIIPADHCLHDVQDMSGFNHPRADLTKGQYGTVGQGLHIAKKLLPYIPQNAGILLVPCCRGASAFTAGNDGTFSETSGASADATRWGVGKPLYQDLLSRTEAALEKNPKNRLLAVCWMQGVNDITDNSQQHGALFASMVQQFRTDLASYSAQCVGGSAGTVPWICGDTTYYWKSLNADKYETIYGGYKGKETQNIFFVPLMTGDNGENTPTNEPAEDPDIPAAGYYGAASRAKGNWTSAQRSSHFSSWSRRGVVSDRLAAAILVHSGRGAEFIDGVGPDAPVTPDIEAGDTTQPEQPGGDPSGESLLLVASYLAKEGVPEPQSGWTVMGGSATVIDDASASGGKALTFSKQEKNAWSMSYAIQGATDLLLHGGKVSCRFKLTGELVANQFAFGIYWKIPVSSVPQGIVFADSTVAGTSPSLLAFYLQTDTQNLNLIYHKKQYVNIGSFGAFNNEWHSLEFLFPGNNSTQVTPVLDNVRGTPFELSNSPATVDEDTFCLSGITAGPTYNAEFELLSVGINMPKN
ncbi:DUF1737 domain-containing protein [Citrobacter freundii]|uniref:DUF1737 domain-containing protein n=2 Tax=Enterobacteriaceae TaxID=543 RepID=A0ABY7KT20_CITFR|nr:DUF6645 domain-containing protein [Citrobacter freundii]EIJ9082420.1 DUF1737 domain-containing protein [Citrobacter freundii]EJH9545360.1 DUF1737 domain-containing protein [Citrobacter freundii]EJO6481230.1 DUF1737 domain-containing protein [Citrobacter freundii]EKW5683888.1 DUF1737 domain-containing protein [Citrobacter freundii]EKX5705400.1 DUF1737 domain-containing protein [Citrobacter freundii]